MRKILRRNAAAAVPDSEYCNIALRRRFQRDGATRGGELERVVQEVDEHLADFVPIRRDRRRRAGDTERDAAALRCAFEILRRCAC
ncbi:hypothetical protein SDC9_83421 [bioreactor metagenome]|uniref:Uncharacterized protein n=1 Tax=bioreactor metagenome TaxID=1076179 RepID=A0A644Z962_9ZZZZ